jgi:hypothetical protein
MQIKGFSAVEHIGWLEDPAWYPPSPKDRKEFAAFAQEVLDDLKERDRDRNRTKEKNGYVRSRRGMVRGNHLTDEKARQLVVCMIASCRFEEEPPPVELERLAAFCLCGTDKIEDIPHPALKMDVDADPRFRAALDYKFSKPWATDNEIASVAGVSRGTVAKVYNHHLLFWMIDNHGVK